MTPEAALHNASDEDSNVYATLENLLRCRLMARDLKLSKQRKILSLQAGMHSSTFRGRGIDFAEVRAYQAGDDIRTIDWRVTARTGRPHTKLYTEERERPALVIVDQSQSMFFGSHVAFKSVVAARAAALLAWSALARGDRIGGIVFADAQHRDIRPRRSYHTVLQLTETLLEYNHALNLKNTPKVSYTLADSLQQARRILKPGSELFVISDFADFDEPSRSHLYQLSKHNDVVCVLIYDRLEEQLPPPGTYAISDGAQRAQINLHDEQVRATYAQIFGGKINLLQSRLDQLKIPLVKLRTDQDLLTGLMSGLGIREPLNKP
ncbi:MAG: DUF58 domain-containing protein [Pseudomonadales bacterium]|nr:DUF58 domain-containing protein [Pseudomonadales bacterium]MCP5214738.1 DUF58 domain-containing protein [Pseudomonadales bacterium]